MCHANACNVSYKFTRTTHETEDNLIFCVFYASSYIEYKYIYIYIFFSLLIKGMLHDISCMIYSKLQH